MVNRTDCANKATRMTAGQLQARRQAGTLRAVCTPPYKPVAADLRIVENIAEIREDVNDNITFILSANPPDIREPA